VGGVGGSFVSMGGTQATGGIGGACGTVMLTLTTKQPSVVMVIDRSGSMDNPFGGTDRWDAVYQALMHPTDGVVKALEHQIRFGLVIYSYNKGEAICPSLVEVLPPVLDNYTAIDEIYSKTKPFPSGETPTGDSLAAVVLALDEMHLPEPKLIVLATDGLPDRCEDPDAHDEISRNRTIVAVQAGFARGYKTFIIAVGPGVSQEHQQDVANAGQGLPVPAASPCEDPEACAPTYEPADKQELVGAFNDIIGGIRNCVLQVEGEVIPGRECDGVVELNGTALPCNDPDGYVLVSPTEIELMGDACDTLMGDGNVTISGAFPCDAVIPPPN